MRRNRYTPDGALPPAPVLNASTTGRLSAHRAGTPRPCPRNDRFPKIVRVSRESVGTAGLAAFAGRWGSRGLPWRDLPKLETLRALIAVAAASVAISDRAQLGDP